MSDKRAELHRRLDRLLDLAEDAENAADPADRAGKCWRTYFESIDFLRDVAGPAIEEALTLDRLGAEPGLPAPEQPVEPSDPEAAHEAHRARWTQTAARVMNDFREIIGIAFPAHAFARDLYEMAQSGAEPIALCQLKKGRGKRELRDLKAAAQRRVVLAVYFEAGRSGDTLDQARQRLKNGFGTAFGDSTWERWRAKVPEADRDDAYIAGEAGLQAAAYEADLHPNVFRRLVQIAISV
jgi:hypothetical protein